MNTKYIMSASAIALAVAGLALSFFPVDILLATGLPASGLPVLLLQVTGAMYLGFAMMNWMAKTVLIGGIYARPLCMGNFLHFTIGAIALAKGSFHMESGKWLLGITLLYGVFSILFGWVLFNGPKKK